MEGQLNRIQRLITLAIALAFSWAPLVSGTWAQTGDPVTAVVGATLIDGTGSPPRQNVTILLQNGRIQKIGPRENTPVPEGGRIIQAEGRYVIPGLIDAHVHYRDYYPELLISHGITSIADWGGSPVEWILVQKEGIEKGKIYGPRIYTCGNSLAEEEVPDPESGRRWVRELAERGVDKIDVTFGVASDVLQAIIDEADSLGLPVSGYPVHTREAIEMGIDAIKHTYVLGSANATDPDRLREIHRQATIADNRARDPHLFLLGDDFDDLLQLMVSKSVAWIPTLAKDFKVIHDRREQFEKESLYLLSHPELQYLPVENLVALLTNDHETGIPVVASGRIGTVDRSSREYQKYRRAYRNLQRFMAEFAKAGGHVLAGTAPHSFVIPGLALHQELQLFVDAGLTPMQALQSATAWVAEYLRKDGDIGTVEEGKLADLVILNENPLEDIRNAGKIETVIQGGRVLPTGYHRSYANPIPRNTSRNAPGAGYPLPQLRTIDPLVTTEGSPYLEVRVQGRRFAPGAVVFFEDIPLETTLVSSNELTAIIPERLLRRVGTYWLHVSNPRPGGGNSEAVSLIVKYE